ncbi:chlorohydrolase family protein [Brachybacterium hainanense]|uniref:Chlorohydrolase family protein n=1 Tax=Brachybacterium hainanense TaxID=1541174 RepID=A0ABV6RC74_9MICO
MITRIRAAYVIGYADGDHQILPDAELVHEDDRILFVGRDYAGHVDVEVDAGSAILAPGFVDLNALADIDHALFDSWQDLDLVRGLSWSEAYLRDHGPVFTREEETFRRRFAISQLLRNGITTMMPIAAETYKVWCEDYQDMADTAGVVAEAGIRAYLGPSYRTAVPYTDGRASHHHVDEAKGLDGLAQAVRFIEDFDGAQGGMIRGALLPARIETQTEQTLRLTRRHADELGVPVRLHATQGLYEMEQIFRRTGMRSLPYLDSLGFLAEKTFIPHAWTVPGHPLMPEKYGTGEDIALMAASGASVLWCPIPAGHYAHTLHTYDSYRAQGVRIVLGTDSAPPNMIKAMDMAMIMMKTATGDRTAAAPADLFRSATLDPAEALGREDLGRLSPGAQADYIVVDLTAGHIGPHLDPIRTLVMNSDGRDITRVVVAGRTVVEDRRLLTIDEDGLLEPAQRFLEKYVASHTRSDHARRTVAQLQPPSFPIG